MTSDDRYKAKGVRYLRLVAANDEPAAKAKPEFERCREPTGGQKLRSFAILPIAAAVGFFAADVSTREAQANMPSLKAEHAVLSGDEAAPLPPQPPAAPRMAQAETDRSGDLDKAAPAPADDRADVVKALGDLRSEIARTQDMVDDGNARASQDAKAVREEVAALVAKVDDAIEKNEFTLEQVARLRKRFEDAVSRADHADAGPASSREDRRASRGYGQRSAMVDPSAVLYGYELKGVVGQVAWLENAQGFMEVKPGSRLPDGIEVVSIRQFGDVFTVEPDAGVVSAQR